MVSDRQRIEIHTHFTDRPSERHVVLLEDLVRPDAQATLPDGETHRRLLALNLERSARAKEPLADEARVPPEPEVAA